MNTEEHANETSTVLLAATTFAVSESRQAQEVLTGGQIDQIVLVQKEAVESLETMLAELKNHNMAAYLGLLTIGVILLWQSFAPTIFRVVPSPLIAVVVATIAATVLTLPVLYVEVPDRLRDEVHFPTLSVLSHSPWSAVLSAALLMAVVASAETLLCATAVDQMHQGPRTKYDRELIAQGVGNVICGVLGALPMTGVIVRSSANVQAGARTRLAAILHGVWLIVFVSALAFLLRMIPTASLAAILVYTGYKLVDLKSLKKLKAYGWGEVAIYAATVGMIVGTDLLTGVVTGIILSALKLLHKFSHLDAELQPATESGHARLKLRGAATFVRLPQLAKELERVPRQAELHVDFEHLDYIDHACLELLMTWAKQHESTGGRLVIDWASLHSRFHGDSENNGASSASSRSSAPAQSVAGLR